MEERMKRTLIILTVAVALVLSSGLLFAKNDPSGQGGKASGNGQGDMLQTQDREMLKTQDRDSLCQEAMDGKLYKWKNSYNYRLKALEKENDEQGLHRYIREIANRYRFENKSDKDEFVEWALKNRPWNTEE
jgi:hypothetical protein